MACTDLIGEFLIRWQFGLKLVALGLNGRSLCFFLGTLLAALAFKLRFLTKLHLTLTFLEGLAGFSDGAPRCNVMGGQTPENSSR